MTLYEMTTQIKINEQLGANKKSDDKKQTANQNLAEKLSKAMTAKYDKIFKDFESKVYELHELLDNPISTPSKQDTDQEEEEEDVNQIASDTN